MPDAPAHKQLGGPLGLGPVKPAGEHFAPRRQNHLCEHRHLQLTGMAVAAEHHIHMGEVQVPGLVRHVAQTDPPALGGHFPKNLSVGIGGKATDRYPGRGLHNLIPQGHKTAVLHQHPVKGGSALAHVVVAPHRILAQRGFDALQLGGQPGKIQHVGIPAELCKEIAAKQHHLGSLGVDGVHQRLQKFGGIHGAEVNVREKEGFHRWTAAELRPGDGEPVGLHLCGVPAHRRACSSSSGRPRPETAGRPGRHGFDP